jgi:hypothetical protein
MHAHTYCMFSTQPHALDDGEPMSSHQQYTRYVHMSVFIYRYVENVQVHVHAYVCVHVHVHVYGYV